MTSKYIIRAENIGKKYMVDREKRRIMLRQALASFTKSMMNQLRGGSDSQANRQKQIFWALRNVSFDIHAGESVGIIGRNGAGKSTLLKLLSRVTAPTEGRAYLRGRVGSLLEVGTGFHQELTGRENIYLNGSVLGMSRREIDRKFDEIVDFSEVEVFLDTPVKYYSSGMKMRLAFSVAAHLEPEILLVDEILAVGDTGFQKKSLTKMENVVKDGRTVLFVSHNMSVVRSLCEKGLYLEKGKMEYFGNMDKAIDLYLNNGNVQPESIFQTEVKPDLQAQIMKVELKTTDAIQQNLFALNESIIVLLEVAIRRQLYQTVISLSVFDDKQNLLFSTYDFEEDQTRLENTEVGSYTCQIAIPPILAPGTYWLTVQVEKVGKKAGWKKRQPIDSVEHICPFQVYDNGSVRTRANLAWQSSFNIPIKWIFQRIR